MKKVGYIAPEMETIVMQSNMAMLAGSDGDGSGQIFGGEGSDDDEI